MRDERTTVNKKNPFLTESSYQLLSCRVTHKLTMIVNNRESMEIMFRNKSFQFANRGDTISDKNDMRQRLHEISSS